ncbi:MAG: hypothetical protein KKB20_15455, partial [Proteobacteria bacterium]|nr:hypothetical protein [Pseudomonadota bacterium]
LQESYLTFFQLAQLYVPLSWLLFANSMIYALTLSVGAWLFGLWGVFFGALFTEALKALWMAWAASRHGLDVRPRWGPGIFKRLAIFSVIFRITTYPLTMFFMVDILWVTRFMSVGDLAVYAMARNFFIQSSVVTRNFTSVHTTQLFEQYGQKADKVKIARDMSMFIQAQLLMSVPVISWGVFWLAPFIIKQFNPLYIQGVYPLTILLIAGFFDARLNNLYSVWVAEKQMIRYGLANTISLGLMVLLISAAWFGLGTRSMTAVAWAVVCGYFANFIFMMGSVGRQIMGWRLTLEIFIKVVLAAAWTGTVFLIMSKPDAAVSPFWVDFKSTMFRAAISLALMSPLILFGIRTSGVAGRVKSWRAALAGTGRLGSDK